VAHGELVRHRNAKFCGAWRVGALKKIPLFSGARVWVRHRYFSGTWLFGARQKNISPIASFLLVLEQNDNLPACQLPLVPTPYYNYQWNHMLNSKQLVREVPRTDINDAK
jgi:hypothetical protein